MKPYLIRPLIEPSESLYGHLLRSAEANLVSPLRVSHRLQLMHPHQLKPLNHATFETEHFVENYSRRFKIEQKTIRSKLATKTCSDKISWHGLLFDSPLFRSTPRVCPICQQATPNLIKDQWYLEPYIFCHEHNYEMAIHEHSQMPLALYAGDVISELIITLDEIFSTPNPINNRINAAQNLIDSLLRHRPKLESSVATELFNLWPMKQFNLFSNMHPRSFVS